MLLPIQVFCSCTSGSVQCTVYSTVHSPSLFNIWWLPSLLIEPAFFGLSCYSLLLFFNGISSKFRYWWLGCRSISMCLKAWPFCFNFFFISCRNITARSNSFSKEGVSLNLLSVNQWKVWLICRLVLVKTRSPTALTLCNCFLLVYLFSRRLSPPSRMDHMWFSSVLKAALDFSQETFMGIT